MSVPEHERRRGKLTSHVAAMDLCEYTLTVAENRSVFESATINRTLERKALAIYADLLEASEMTGASKEVHAHRYFLARRAAAQTRGLLALIDVACRSAKVRRDRVEYWTDLARAVRDETDAWINESE